MRNKRSGWKGKLAAIFIIACLAIYPALIIRSHNIPDAIPDTISSTVWADTRIGAAIDILETEQNRWSFGLADWHPQSRLTAMPAFQRGMADTLSQFIALRAGLASTRGQADQDLRLAASLIGQAISEGADDQLFAATQALRRHDGLIARGVLTQRTASELLADETRLYAALVEKSHSDLRAIIRAEDRRLFDATRTDVFYKVHGQLYVIGALLKAGDTHETGQSERSEAIAELEYRLDEAYRLSPLLVSNPAPGQFSFGGNDLMALAYMLDDISLSLAELTEILEAEQRTIVSGLAGRS
ncbi:hypothetical protein [Ponticaulis sp.]|uniref:hypothetical protein n=1 Tax=Ponticaulis sp. TaxID=2020902 RepID=UPI000B703109|nr:hypothetical protein [Ponticaulis sp.]MAI91073.1 hypothetical protein [Ponticaulis sp.]OUX98401.1 MAG: hypothetical protein CBB65_11550 [Hyphomonadaceae bacterium TMED5]|tara:strand:+ start:69952 stop:70851 length:900 start_codon:yes stop_codon:yes gene_type:complete